MGQIAFIIWLADVYTMPVNMGQIAFIIWLEDVYTMPVNMGQIAFIIWLTEVYTMVGRRIHNGWQTYTQCL